MYTLRKVRPHHVVLGVLDELNLAAESARSSQPDLLPFGSSQTSCSNSLSGEDTSNLPRLFLTMLSLSQSLRIRLAVKRVMLAAAAMDKAVHAGGFCEIGGKLGTVEDIGLRSLRLRTLDQNLLVVPNSVLASMQFQNMKARPKLLISQNFSLRIETSADQLRVVLNRVQQMLNEHPFIESGSSRIRIADFAGAAFGMELWAYVKTGDWADFTGIRQDVLLKITEIVESAGTRLAAPTRLTYVSTDVRVVDALKSHKISAA